MWPSSGIRRERALAAIRAQHTPLADHTHGCVADWLYLEKAKLTPALAHRPIRLAIFANPEFYKAQALRLSVWDKPRLIGCAESLSRHVAWPRGGLKAVHGLLQDHGIGCELHDERLAGRLCGVVPRAACGPTRNGRRPSRVRTEVSCARPPPLTRPGWPPP